MHEKGVTHRDIKVENILLTKQDTIPKLCDFGSASKETIDLAKISKSQLYTYEDIFERNTTLTYRPPEMIDLYLGYRVDQKVDIWMLGCVVYTMNYYVHPFQEGGKLAIVNASFKFPELDRVSEKMKDFIRHMLTPDPASRPDIHEILNILENWATGEIKLNVLIF
jgi:AP2-associated kinase